MNGEYDFDHEVWDSVSAEAIDFVSHVLQVDSSARPDAGKAMRHAWFRKLAFAQLKDSKEESKDDNDAVERTLREADFKRVALNVRRVVGTVILLEVA